jgi:MarR family transcriptional regulator, organic hydroperoxide resistance regulator
MPGKKPKKDKQFAEGPFPPLSTTLPAFVKGGSDAGFRELIYDLTALSNIIQRNRRHFGAYIGVSEAQALMMMIMSEREGVTVGSIAQQLDVTSQFVTTEIGNLVKRGIVQKRPNDADRRSMFLDLTARGRDLIRELGSLRRKTNDTVFRSLTEERAKVLKEVVVALIADGRVALHELESPHLRKPRKGQP